MHGEARALRQQGRRDRPTTRRGAVAQPGEAWVYGYNTDVLGCVAERRFIARRLAADLIQRADKLMYEAKGQRASHIYLTRMRLENGNLVEFADTDTQPPDETEQQL